MKTESKVRKSPSSVSRLHVIVTCSDRKTHEPPQSLRISSLSQGLLADRVAAWTGALETDPSSRVTANELYSGDQWHVAHSISASAPHDVEVCTWIASAGYGLIKPETSVKPYAATFTPRHPDAVVPPNASYRAADWWRELAAWRTPGHEEPRTVAAIARRAAPIKNEFVLVAVSESYAIAMADDIEAAAQQLPDRFALISVGLWATALGLHQPPAPYLMPGEAKLQNAVGGATHSLNARIARRAVKEASRWLSSTARLSALMQEWLDASPPAIRYERDRLSDDDVRAFVLDQLRENPHVTCTASLRTLRNAGKGCEQARFAALFRDALPKATMVFMDGRSVTGRIT